VVEIAYGTAPQHRGRGIATHVLRRVSDWCFEQLHAERVELLISEGNLASCRVAAKAGSSSAASDARGCRAQARNTTICSTSFSHRTAPPDELTFDQLSTSPMLRSLARDFRLRGQERYLQDATFVRKPYRVRSEAWEHDHCEFCSAKFIDPAFSDAHAAMYRGDPTLRTEGYAALDTGPRREDDYHWICETCFEDFRDRFSWKVVGLKAR
jgi:hypothetical protein